MGDYRVLLVDRKEHIQGGATLRGTPSGYIWEDDSGEELDIPPAQTIIKARRALEREMLLTHWVFWPEKKTSPLREKPENKVWLHIPFSLRWELEALRAVTGKSLNELCRMILQDYVRPGTLPPLEQLVTDTMREEYKAKVPKIRID